MAELPIFYSEAITYYYEIPLFLFIIIGIYAVYKLMEVRRRLSKSSLRDSVSWFSAAGVWLILWAVDHGFHDLVPLPSHLILFFHYVISHGFLLIAMIFIAVATIKLKKACDELPGKFRAKAEKR